MFHTLIQVSLSISANYWFPSMHHRVLETHSREFVVVCVYLLSFALIDWKSLLSFLVRNVRSDDPINSLLTFVQLLHRLCKNETSYVPNSAYLFLSLSLLLSLDLFICFFVSVILCTISLKGIISRSAFLGSISLALGPSAHHVCSRALPGRHTHTHTQRREEANTHSLKARETEQCQQAEGVWVCTCANEHTDL